MARVFISHSSRDCEPAARIKVWLQDQDFEAPFLDFDKHAGIPPGADWEKTLYREIELSQAVIIIQTPNWMDSKWCFAEYTQARALGKAIFPVIETPTGETLIAPDIQALNLLSDREGGLEQLSKELTRIALDAQGGFPWDSSRPPYPGLSAFQEEDAALYFGRDDDIRRLIERLNARRAQGGTKLIALLGASGSGKSSLLRAGVIPRIKRDRRNWIVLPPMRPQTKPVDELARAIAVALDQGTEWRSWRDQLSSADLGRTLSDVASDLRMQADANEAQILIAIDQAEELFGTSEPADADRFFDILNVAMSDELPFLAVLAQRSDYLEKLQSAEKLTARFEEFSLGPLPLSRIPQIIEGPAHVAGLSIDDSLVLQASKDAETEDALPLLAFALRELFDRYGVDNHLDLENYRALGDPKADLTPLENAVRKSADDVLDDARPGEAELTALREAFVPAMVRVNDKGEYVRSPAQWDELPANAHPLLERLAKARLLVISQEGDNRVVEVAHEALLRKWPRLRSWLDDAREFLTGKQQLERDLYDWQRAAEADKPTALLTGLKLNRAQGWLLERSHQFTSQERAFVQASIDNAEAEERRKARLRLRITLASIVASFVLLIVAGIAVFRTFEANAAKIAAERSEAIAKAAKAEADSQANLALSRKLASDARLAFASDQPEIAVLLSAEGYRRAATSEAERALFDILESQPFLRTTLRGPEKIVTALAFTPTDGLLLAGDVDGQAALWDPESGERREEFSFQRGLTDFAFDRTGKVLATTGHSIDIAIYSQGLPQGEPVTIPYGCDVSWTVGAFTVDEELYTACRYQGIMRWDFALGDWVEVTQGSDVPETVGAGAFSPDQPIAALYDLDGLSIWDTRNGARAPLTFNEQAVKEIGDANLMGIDFVPQSPFFVTAGGEDLVVWNTGREKPQSHLRVPYDLSSVTASPNGRSIATGTRDGKVLIWDLSLPRKLGRPLGADGNRIRSMSLGPDGNTLAVGGTGGLLMLWDIIRQEPIGRQMSGRPGKPGSTVDAFFADDGTPVAVVNIGNTVLRLDMLDGRPVDKLSNIYAQPHLDGIHAGGVHARAWKTSIEILDFMTGETFRIENLDAHASDKSVFQPVRLALSENGSWLAVAYLGGNILLVDLAAARASADELGVELGDVLGEPSAARAAFVHQLSPATRSEAKAMGVGNLFLGIAADGTRVAISDGSKVVAWTRDGIDWKSHSLSETVLPPDDRVKPREDLVASLALSPDGRILAADTLSGMTVWDLETGQVRYVDISIIRSVHQDHEKTQFPSLSISPDSRKIAIRGDDGYVIWNIVAGTAAIPLEFPTSVKSRARFNDDGTLLLAFSSTAMSMWALETRQLVAADRRVLLGDVRHIVFDATGTRLASIDTDRSVVLWNLDQPDRPHSRFEYPDGVNTVTFSEKGGVLRVVDASGTIHDRDTATGALLDRPGRTIPAGETALAVDDDGNIRGWATKEGLWVRAGDSDRLAVPAGRHAKMIESISALAVDATGEVLVSDHRKGELAIWEAKTGRPFIHPLIGMRTIRDIRFSGDDRVVVLGVDADGAALWEVRIASILERACRAVNRNLTSDEWEAYVGDLADYRETCPGR